MKSMKTAFVAFLMTLLLGRFVHAAELEDYIGVNADTTENRLAGLHSLRTVEDTQAGDVSLVSSAAVLTLPDGVTSATVTSATFGVNRRINGVDKVVLSNLSYSFWSTTTKPSLFAEDASGNKITVSGTFTGTPVNGNPKKIFITSQPITIKSDSTNFPKLVAEGDYYQFVRTIKVVYMIDGVAQPEVTYTGSSKVLVVDETTGPITGPFDSYPDPGTQITSVTKVGDTTEIMATGVTVDSYNHTWWMEESTGLNTWSYTNAATVTDAGGGMTKIVFTIDPVDADGRQFYRLRFQQP